MLEYEVPVKEGVQVSLEGRCLKMQGPKGELSRDFSHPKVKVAVKGSSIVISSEEEGRKVKALMGTWRAHMKNMMTGVMTGWTCTLKLVYAHFPVKLEAKDGRLVIKNFLGARSDRHAELVEGVDVKIEGDTLRLTGADKEKVGQAAANIEYSTRVKGFDKRVFQDGIYLTAKPVPAGGS